MELIEVLAHQGPPRDSLVVKMPSLLGELRLDLLGGEEAFAAITEGRTLTDAEYAALLASAGERAEAGDGAGYVEILLDVARRDPFTLEPYTRLSRWYEEAGDLAEATYFARQALALRPAYRARFRLANLLGRSGRLDQARVVFAHLFESRHECGEPGVRYDATADYLQTLLQLEDWPALRDLSTQVWEDYPGDVGPGFHLAVAALSLREPAAATAALDRIEPFLPPDHILTPQVARLRAEIR
jgi:tetratricopeptide (TPR) repeat protein